VRVLQLKLRRRREGESGLVLDELILCAELEFEYWDGEKFVFLSVFGWGRSICFTLVFGELGGRMGWAGFLIYIPFACEGFAWREKKWGDLYDIGEMVTRERFVYSMFGFSRSEEVEGMPALALLLHRKRS
jgi:hypothetical protein